MLCLLLVFFSGPLDALPADRRAKLRERTVRRFSSAATTAVLILAATGLYAILLHVPDPAALVGTPYGRALLTKLGLLVLLLGIGGTNYFLRGRGPFGRLVGAELVLALAIFVATGFLTSLPPATAVWQEAPAKDVEVFEVALDPVGDSVTSGIATFRERDAGLELTLEVSGLPKPGAEYFGEIREGVCENGRQGGEPGSKFADASRPASVTVHFKLLSAGSPRVCPRRRDPPRRRRVTGRFSRRHRAGRHLAARLQNGRRVALRRNQVPRPPRPGPRRSKHCLW